MDEKTQQPYAHAKIPAAFVTEPHEFTAQNGQTYQRSYIRLPPNTKVGDKDFGGYSTSVLMNDHQRQNLADGKMVNVSFDTSRSVKLDLAVDAQDLVNGIKDEMNQFMASVHDGQAAPTADSRPYETQTPTPDDSQQKYVSTWIPAAFVTEPHEFTAQNGQTYQRSYIRLPPNTMVNNRDLGGQSTSVLMNEYQRQNLADGKMVKVSFDTSHPVHMAASVDAWDLVKGIKAEMEQFKSAQRPESVPQVEETIAVDDMEVPFDAPSSPSLSDDISTLPQGGIDGTDVPSVHSPER